MSIDFGVAECTLHAPEFHFAALLTGTSERQRRCSKLIQQPSVRFRGLSFVHWGPGDDGISGQGPRGLASGPASKSFRWLIMPSDSGCPVRVDYCLEVLQYRSGGKLLLVWPCNFATYLHDVTDCQSSSRPLV